MGFEQGHHREPAGIGDPEHAHAAVVVLHVLHQPVDRVVGVGSLVDRLGIGRRARGPDHHEIPLGLVSAPDVLEGEEVAVIGQVLEILVKRRGSTAIDSVRRAQEDDRQRPALLGRPVNQRVQLDPVAHRNHDLGLLVAGGIGPDRTGRRQQSDGCKGHEKREKRSV